MLGVVPFVRYAVLMVKDAEGGHLQSLLVGAVLLLMSFLSLMLGVISDLIRTNRVLIEDNLEHTKKMRFARTTGEAARVDPEHSQDLYPVEAARQLR